jgi:hypothetical protein
MKRLLIAASLLGAGLASGVLALVPISAGFSTASTAGVSKSGPGMTTGGTASPKHFSNPLAFEVNAGQTDARVKFLAHGQGYSLFLTNRDAVFAFQGRKTNGKGHDAAATETSSFRMSFVGASEVPQVSGTDLLEGYSNYLIGTDPKQWHTHVENYAKVLYTDLYPGVSALYYGNERNLEYDVRIQPGANIEQIAMDLDGATDTRLNDDGSLTFRCGLRQITLQKPAIYQLSATGSRVDVPGSWLLKGPHTLGFEVQKYDHARELVIDPTFNFGLVNFPFATFLGGSGYDNGSGIAVDSTGDVYVTGTTGSTDFPKTKGELQPTNLAAAVNATSAFVSKYTVETDPLNDGASVLTLQWSTYLGGKTTVLNVVPPQVPNSSGNAIAVNSAGNAIVTGDTAAHGSFPTFPVIASSNTGCISNPTTLNDCSGGFIVELAADGASELYGGYIVGAGGLAIALDSAGYAYVTGNAFGGGTGSLQSTFGGGNIYGDAFVTKIVMNSSLGTLGNSAWWTYLGGSGDDCGTGIALDNTGNVYVTGFTDSVAVGGTGGFPTLNPLQATNAGGYDAFAAEINNAGTALVYSTYLGGSGNDYGYAIAVDPKSGNAFVTGSTASANFPIIGAPQSSPLQSTFGGTSDAFVSQIAAKGTDLVYSTYLGGAGADQGNGIAVDANDNAYVTGAIGSAAIDGSVNGVVSTTPNTIGSIDPNIINLTANSIQPQCGNTATCSNGFVTEINPSGNQFVYFTYLGGSGSDSATAIALDDSASCADLIQTLTTLGSYSQSNLPFSTPCVDVTGYTTSADFPVSPPNPLSGITSSTGNNPLPVINNGATTSPAPSDAFLAQIPSLATPVCAPTLTQTGLTATVSIECTAKFSGGSGTVNFLNNAPSGVTCAGNTSIGLNGEGQTGSTSCTYSAPTTVTPSVNMQNSVGNGLIYATPFPTSQYGPITVTVFDPLNTNTFQEANDQSTFQLEATVQNATVTGVTWAVSPAGEGTISNCPSFNSPIGPVSAGTETACGIYTPPSGLTAPIAVDIIATATADNMTSNTTPPPTQGSTAAGFPLTVNPPITLALTLNPNTNSVQAGAAPITITANISSWATSQNATWQLSGTGCNGGPCGSISTTGPSASVVYTPPAETPSSASVSDTVTATTVAQPGPTPVSTTFTVTSLPISIAGFTPTTPPIEIATLSAPVQFSAMAKGATNTAVNWSITGTCNNSPCGKVSSTGLYTPPSTVMPGSTETDTVTATAQADSAETQSAQITLYNPATISLNPSTVTVQAGSAGFAVTAQLTPYAASPNVNWQLTGAGCTGAPSGSITTAGPSTSTVYTPPATLPSPASVTDCLTATSVSEPTQNGHSIITVSALPTVVSISPTSPPIEIATLSGPIQFQATVTGPTNKNVVWSITGTCNGLPCGSVSSSGLYTPPSAAMPGSTEADTVTATSQAITTQSASAQITLYNPATVNLSPNNPSVQAGSAAIMVTAQLTPYAASQNVTWVLTGPGCAGTPSGSISTPGPSTSTLYTPPLKLSSGASVTDCLTATSVSEPKQSGHSTITVTPLPISVTIAPTSATVVASQSTPIQFSAVVTGPSNTNVVWSISGNGCANAPCGSLSATGLYTPPSAPIANPTQVDIVTAASQADSTKTASAKVTIDNPVAITINPSGKFAIEIGKSIQFDAPVSGSSDTGVLWHVTGTGCNGGPCGTISSTGVYQAPATLASSQTDTISATAVADNTKTATALAVIFLPATATPPPSVTITPGQTASYSVTLSPGGGDPLNATALSCFDLPNGASCQFTPSSTLAIGATSFTVQVTTTAPTTSSLGKRSNTMLAALIPLAGLLLLGLRVGDFRRRLLGNTSLLVLSILLASGLIACGTGGSFGTNQLPSLQATPQGNFSISVIGTPQVTAGQASPSPVTTLQLTVN